MTPTLRLCLALLLLPMISFAQENTPGTDVKPLKHEIGINLLSVTDFHTYRNDPGPGRTTDVDVHPLAGVFYKYHTGRNVLRVGLNYNQQVVFTNYAIDTYWQKSEGVRRAGEIHAGYERVIGNCNKLQPFVSGDLFALYSNYSGKESYIGCFGSCENCPFSWSRMEAGIAIGAGARYAVSPHFVVTLEAAAKVFYDTYLNGPGFLEYRLNPVQTLGVSYRF